MYCFNCGEKLIDKAITCPSCGTEIRQAPPASEVASASEFWTTPLEAQEPLPFSTEPAAYPRRLSDRAKKLILVGMAAVVIVFLILKFTGGVGSQSTPDKAVKGFFNAVKKADGKKAYSYLSISIEEDNLPEGLDKKSIIERFEGRPDENRPELGNIEINDVNIDGDKATIGYKVDLALNGEKSTEEGTMELIKSKGKWYVVIPF
jgi:uncharacterized membrane protein YvbJ